MQPSSPPATSPTVPAAQLRFSSCLRLKSYACPASIQFETTFPALTRAHRAFWARLMRLRAEADSIRLRPAPLREGAERFNPTKPLITSSNFSTRNLACLYSSCICWSAFSRFDADYPANGIVQTLARSVSDLKLACFWNFRTRPGSARSLGIDLDVAPIVKRYEEPTPLVRFRRCG